MNTNLWSQNDILDLCVFGRLEKLRTLRRLLEENSSKKSVVHLELASIGDKALMKSILEIVILENIPS